ncbi:MAG TPA: P1 family peptidase [Kiloniellales bacterium]|nr:P1 family peptidase [Kiloniellales bacterium]
MTGRVLELDFPALHVGVAEYTDGPTGATVFYFPERAIGTVDVRGGAPGTYNTDWLRLGYGFRDVDAIAIAGGSWYGLAASGGVAGALKAEGRRTGHWANLANVAGAIIYDLGDRRINEIHPDERLGAAALLAAAPGRFPQGAAGAGRMTMQGSYFGLWLHSGQGGAFRQVGRSKIACFAVVNAVGAVVDRAGRLAHGGQRIPTGETTIQELLALLPEGLHSGAESILGVRTKAAPSARNTTISLVATNRKLTYAELQRLAIQVHASMARAIQPFATVNDGDVLFALSTDELEDPEIHPSDLGTLASEVMWDAVLASVPDRGLAVPAAVRTMLAATGCVGRYGFAPGAVLAAEPSGSGTLRLRVAGERPIYAKEPGEAWEVTLEPDGSFALDDVFLSAGRFVAGTGGRAEALELNPGSWMQRGSRND